MTTQGLVFQLLDATNPTRWTKRNLRAVADVAGMFVPARQIASAALLATLLACDTNTTANAPPLPSVPLPAELDQVLRDYEGAYARRDAGALAELFAEDGYLLQPGRPAIRGRPAIAAALQGEGGALALVPTAYRLGDSAAYIIGTFGAERAADEGGKFVLALERRAAGPWRIAADIANPNRP